MSYEIERMYHQRMDQPIRSARHRAGVAPAVWDQGESMIRERPHRNLAMELPRA